MRVTDLERIYDYGYWANARLFAVLAQLTADEFTRPVLGSHESIRSTLVHALSAEWGWLDRCGGQVRGPKLDPDDYPTVESVSDAWHRVEGYVREFLSRLNDDDLTRGVEFTLGSSAPRSIALGDLMQHARSEEHTSELQSRFDLVCRLLLEKKKNNIYQLIHHKHNNI